MCSKLGIAGALAAVECLRSRGTRVKPEYYLELVPDNPIRCDEVSLGGIHVAVHALTSC